MLYEVSGVNFEVNAMLASDMIYNLIYGGRDLCAELFLSLIFCLLFYFLILCHSSYQLVKR